MERSSGTINPTRNNPHKLSTRAGRAGKRSVHSRRLRPVLAVLGVSLLALLVVLAPVCLAGVKWTTDGVPVRHQPGGSAGSAQDPQIIPDGSGGAIITWMEARYGGLKFLVFAQKVDSNGNRLWTNNGVEVRGSTVPSPTGWGTFPQIASDGAGGCIITWMDDRYNTINGVNKIDIYAQRVDANGTCRWTKDGVGVRSQPTTLDYAYFPEIASDGAGGAIITWTDFRTAGPDWMNPLPGAHYHIYAQRVNANGNCLWTTDGVGVRSQPTTLGSAKWPQLVADGTGGAIITWQDWRRLGDIAMGDIYAQKVAPDGRCVWTADGVGVRSQTISLNSPMDQRIVSDGSGGAIISWQEVRSNNKREVYAQRVDVNGTCRWATDGIVVRSQNLPGNDFSTIGGDPVIAPDGFGGAVIAWNDTRSGIANKYDIYAQRVDANGNLIWAVGGVGVRSLPGNANQAIDQVITPDGSGGAIITWTDRRYDNPGGPGADAREFIYAQRVDGSGHCRWTTDGAGVCTAAGEYAGYPQITSDGSGGAIITWEDYRTTTGGSTDIFAQKITDDVPDAPTVTGITPYSGANNGTVNITNLAGTSFQKGAQAMLRMAGHADIVANPVNVVSANQITCSFNINGVTTGVWDVVVRNPDGREGKYASGFSVTAPAAACGASAGVSVAVLAGLLGMLSLAGLGTKRKRR